MHPRWLSSSFDGNSDSNSVLPVQRSANGIGSQRHRAIAWSNQCRSGMRLRWATLRCARRCVSRNDGQEPWARRSDPMMARCGN